MTEFFTEKIIGKVLIIAFIPFKSLFERKGHVEMKQKGAFICIEGIDGSGKTTQAYNLVKTLRQLGYEAVYTTEPSEGRYGKIIRKQILRGNNRVPPALEAVLFAADRLDHVQREIKPFLNSRKIIICDRYLYSSIAYQGAADLNVEWIESINKHAIKPHLAIYIDIPPETIITRLKRRRKTVMETLQIQRQVREQYLRLVAQEKLMLVYGNTSKREVAEAIQNIVLKFIQKHANLPIQPKA